MSRSPRLERNYFSRGPVCISRSQVQCQVAGWRPSDDIAHVGARSLTTDESIASLAQNATVAQQLQQNICQNVLQLAAAYIWVSC